MVRGLLDFSVAWGGDFSRERSWNCCVNNSISDFWKRKNVCGILGEERHGCERSGVCEDLNVRYFWPKSCEEQCNMKERGVRNLFNIGCFGAEDWLVAMSFRE